MLTHRRQRFSSFHCGGFQFQALGFQFDFNSKLKTCNLKLSILQQLPQHVFQNPSMPIVIQFHGCIDTADDFELGDFAVITGRLYGEFLSQQSPVVMPATSNFSNPVRPRDLRFSPALNCSGTIPMPIRLLR